MNRHALKLLIDELRPYDARESADKTTASQWVESSAPLYRIQKPDVPPMHLVSYFAIIDPSCNKILLQDHLLAKLWLPAGGHVDQDEDPADTVRRECAEELGIEASFLGSAAPHFITVTKTQGQGEHTDVSLWYTLQASKNASLTIEPDRFAEVRWWSIDDVLAAPITMFDPELHRFLKKLNVRGIIS